MKACNSCGLTLGFDRFSPLKSGRHGLNPVCKECRAASEKARRQENPELIRALERARHKANPGVKKASIKRYYETNKPAILLKEHQRYDLKADAIKLQKQQYRALNPEKIRFHNGTRRASQRMAMPLWANRKQIAEIYRSASELWISTGEPYHVDHIIPLKHDLVCGLHVPANLQVLRGVDNIRKGNRFEIAD